MILKKESNAYIILILKSYQSLKLFKQECGFYYIKDGTVKVCNTFKMQVDINLYYLLSKNYKKNATISLFGVQGIEHRASCKCSTLSYLPSSLAFGPAIHLLKSLTLH